MTGTPGDTTTQPTPRRAVRVTPPPVAAVPRNNSRPAWAIAGVLGVALMVALFFALELRTQVNDLSTELAQHKLVAQRLGERLAEREATVNALTMPENDLVVVRLTAVTEGGPAMRVFWNQRTGLAVMQALNFPPLAKDRAYVLWMMHDGKTEPVQLFTVEADGRRLLNGVALPTDPQGTVAFSVTEEPAGGSPQPTSAPFLAGETGGKSL